MGWHLAKLGLNSLVVVGATRDGGGENEGQQRSHAYVEHLETGDVRRRCIPHMSWRTCDLVIKASGLGLKALAAYLCAGFTGWRLKQLATTAP